TAMKVSASRIETWKNKNVSPSPRTNPIVPKRDVKSILLVTIVPAARGRELRFHNLFPSLPIEVIPRNNVPRPTPKSSGTAKNNGLIRLDCALAVGAGEKSAGKDIITGRIIGIAINRTTSFLRVAERISRLTSASEVTLSPIFLSLLTPDIVPVFEK